MFKYVYRALQELKYIVTSDEVVSALKSNITAAIAGVIVGSLAIFIGGTYWWILDLIVSILLGMFLLLIVIPWLESSRFSKLAEVL